MPSFADRALRVAMTAVHSVMKAGWFVRRPKTFGAHAVALTPAGKLILIKLRYAAGWRIPGGGRSASEPAIDAALRELREEIGMTAHGEVQLACELQERVDWKHDAASLVIVRDVEYRPKWNLEVESIRETAPDDLPADLSPQTRRWLQRIAPEL
jgi:8-oxo-dGTP pyrophosphatase MutT (NUDIX family)